MMSPVMAAYIGECLPHGRSSTCSSSRGRTRGPKRRCINISRGVGEGEVGGGFNPAYPIIWRDASGRNVTIILISSF